MPTAESGFGIQTGGEIIHEAGTTRMGDSPRTSVTWGAATSEETIEPNAAVASRQPLGLAWPPEVFSLTHVAIPFPPDDPLYGLVGPGQAAGLLPIGRLSPRGERAVLTVGTDTLMRLSSNPFFPFVAERVSGWVGSH